MADGKLNPRQLKFVENILSGDMTLVDAYRKAGYSDKGDPWTCASRLHRNADILEEIESRLSSHTDGVRARLHKLTDASTNVYIRILKIESENDRVMEVQRRIAVDVLDRIGLKPVEKVKMDANVQGQISLGDIVVYARHQKDAE